MCLCGSVNVILDWVCIRKITFRDFRIRLDFWKSMFCLRDQSIIGFLWRCSEAGWRARTHRLRRVRRWQWKTLSGGGGKLVEEMGERTKHMWALAWQDFSTPGSYHGTMWSSVSVVARWTTITQRSYLSLQRGASADDLSLCCRTNNQQHKSIHYFISPH